MRTPLTPGMLRHAADLMEGRAAGMKIMAVTHDGAREGGLPIGPTLRSLAHYILAKLGDGWKLRLVQRDQPAPGQVDDSATEPPTACLHKSPDGLRWQRERSAAAARLSNAPTAELSPADESARLRQVAELLDGAAKGTRIIVTCPDGVQHHCVADTGKLLNLLRVGCTLHLEGPPKKVPLTRDEMSKLVGRVLVWPDHDRLCVGTCDAHAGRSAQLARTGVQFDRVQVSAQQLLDESVLWRDVGDDPEGAKLHRCWTVTT